MVLKVNGDSKITADVYLRTLGLFCELNNTDSEKIVKHAKDDTREFKNKFLDFVRSLKKQGKAGSYIVRFKKTLKSWLKFNDIDLKLDVKIKVEYETP